MKDNANPDDNSRKPGSLMYASHSPKQIKFKKRWITKNTDLPRTIILNKPNFLMDRKEIVAVTYLAFRKHIWCCKQAGKNCHDDMSIQNYLDNIFRNYLSSAFVSSPLKHYIFFEDKQGFTWSNLINQYKCKFEYFLAWGRQGQNVKVFSLRFISLSHFPFLLLFPLKQ